MTTEDFDTWRVLYSHFVGAYSKSGISFAPNKVPVSQNSCRGRKKITVEMVTETAHARRDLALPLLGATVYGLSITLNTINPRRAGGGRFYAPP